MDSVWPGVSNLEKRWIAGCETIDDVIDLLVKDAIIKLMSKQFANHVRDHNTDTLASATTLADDYSRT